MNLQDITLTQELFTTEEIDPSVVNTLYNNIDIISEANGRLHTYAAKAQKMEALQEKFPNLIINTDEEIIIDANDSLNEANLMKIMQDNLFSESSSYMLRSEAEKVQTFQDIFFDGVDNFSCGKYFTNVKEIHFSSGKGANKIFHNNNQVYVIDFSNLTKIIDDSGNDVGIFFKCTNLQNISLDNLEEYYCKYGRFNYGEALFGGCTSLKSIKLPKIKYLIGEMFYGCTSLKLTNFKEAFPNVTKFYGYGTREKDWQDTYGPSDTLLYDVYDDRYSIFTNTKCNFTELPEEIEWMALRQFPWADTTGTQTHPLYNSKFISWGGYKDAEDALTNCIVDNDKLQTDGEGNIILKKNQQICGRAFDGNINLKSIIGCGAAGKNAFQNCTNLKRLDIKFPYYKQNIVDGFVNGAGLRGTLNLDFEQETNISQNMLVGNKFFIINLTPRVQFSTNCGIGKYMHKVNCNYLKELTSSNFFNPKPKYLKFIEFNQLTKVEPYLFNTQSGGSDNTNSVKIIYLNQNTVPETTRTISGMNQYILDCNIYVPVGMKEQYTSNASWSAISDRIIETTPEQLEQIKKQYYGVDFYSDKDKWYNTKRTPTRNARFYVEYEKAHQECSQGKLFGGRLRDANDQRVSITFDFVMRPGVQVGNISYTSNSNQLHTNQYVYNKLILDVDFKSIKLTNQHGETIIDTTISPTINSIPNIECYLGAMNDNGNATDILTGTTIYKFLWYESDVLVQAWIGNEDGGFDIYADEDIELQENDRKFNLNEYNP